MEKSMTDAHDALHRRSERGTPRGADAVWRMAHEQPYVGDVGEDSRPSPVLWSLAGAAAVALIVAAVALRPSSPGEISAAFVGDGSSEAPATCLLEVTNGADRPLDDWADAVERTPGISGVETIHAREGTISLVMLGHPSVEIPAGTRGISFHARPARVAEKLGNVDGVDHLRCWVAPDWAWVPDEPPAGTRPVIAFYQPDAEADIYDQWAAILAMDGVLAAEPITQQQSYDEFAELYAESPDVVAAVSPEILPPSVRIVADARLADDVMAKLEGSPGIYRVVEPPTPLWLARADYEIDTSDEVDPNNGGTTTTVYP